MAKVYAALLCLPHSNADRTGIVSGEESPHQVQKEPDADTLTAFLQCKINCDTPCCEMHPTPELLQTAKSATNECNKAHV